MWVTPEDFVPLTGFSLLWRWTREAHAQFGADELASIRPIHPTKAAKLCERLVSSVADPSRTVDRLAVEDDTAVPVVSRWLDGRVPGGENEVLLLWDRETAAVVPRRLFIDRWSDFWYPSSDDLTVMGIVGGWEIQMYHHGMFEFFAGGAIEHRDEPDRRCTRPG